MHTKNGNNNSYNKDDGTNYLNWDKAVKKDTFENRIMEYIRNLIKFRNENSIFRSNEFIKSLQMIKILQIKNQEQYKNISKDA